MVAVFIKIFRARKICISGLELPVLIFVGLSVLTGILEEMPPIQIVVGLRPYLKWPLFFFVLINLDFKPQFYKNQIRSFFALYVVSVFLSFYQFHMWGGGDNSSGFLRAGHHGQVSVSIILLMVGSWLFNRVRATSLIFVALVLISILIAEAKAMVFFLPVILLILFRRTLLPRPFITVAVAVFMVFGLYLSVKHSQVLSRTALPVLFQSTEEWKIALTHDLGDGEINRIPRITYSINYLLDRGTKLIFGIGPGAVSPSSLSVAGGSEELIKLGLFRSELSKVLMEQGLLGLCIYIFISARLFFLNRAAFFREQDPYWKAVSFAFEGMILLFLFSTIYNEILQLDAINFLFWTIAAAICTLRIETTRHHSGIVIESMEDRISVD